MLVLLVDRPNKAEAGAFATEFTQVLNHGQLVMEYIRQGQELANALDMYREQIRNGLALPRSFLRCNPGGPDISCWNRARGPARWHTRWRIWIRSFEARSPAIGTNSNVYFTKYRNWSTAALDTIRGTLRAAGLQGSQLAIGAGGSIGASITSCLAEWCGPGHPSDD